MVCHSIATDRSLALMRNVLLPCLFPIFISPINCWDGDTCKDVRFFMPFGLEKVAKVRLIGIDAPEMKSPTMGAAKVARDWLRKQVAMCGNLKAKAHGADSFGRELITLYCGRSNLNKKMLRLGLAWKYEK